MKGVLVFKDGRRVEMRPGEVGGIRFHRSHRGPDGEYLETVFESEAELVDGCIVYVESETRDITKLMERAAEANRERTMAVVRKGLS